MPQVLDPPSPLCHEFPFLRDVELVERSLSRIDIVVSPY